MSLELSYSSVGPIPSSYLSSRARDLNLLMDCWVKRPKRISLSMSTNSTRIQRIIVACSHRRRQVNLEIPWSVCLKTLVKLKVLLIVSVHNWASKANLGVPFFMTGGNWKKSPVTTSYNSVWSHKNVANTMAIYLYPAKRFYLFSQYTSYSSQLIE